MKKLLLLFAALFVIASCSLDHDTKPDFHVEFIPTISVDMPESVTPGHSYPINIYYKRPNDCYLLDGFYYDIQDNTRIVAVQTVVFEDGNCQPIASSEPEMTTLTFECPTVYAGTSYTFKFYTGTDTSGTQQFIEVTVPIVAQ